MDKIVDDIVAVPFSQMPSATGSMARLAYAQAKAKGIAPEPLLKASGLTLRQMEDSDIRLAVRDQIKFLNLAADVLGDGFLGFHLAKPLDLRQIGLLYYVMASSELLIDALHRGARYSSIVNEGISQKFKDGDDLRVSFKYVGVSRHLDRHQMEFWMTALLRICRQLTSIRVVPTRVRLTHLRKGACSELAEFFGTDVEFGATVDEMTFAKRVEHLPIVSADPHLNKLLIKYCEEALSYRRGERGSFRSSVENAIVPLLPHGKVRAEDIAHRLGVSERTFARRLALEGVTFSGLVESLRFDLAKHYLTEESLPVSQIAWLLGYREVGAFSHAFKRWTGASPRNARHHV